MSGRERSRSPAGNPSPLLPIADEQFPAQKPFPFPIQHPPWPVAPPIPGSIDWNPAYEADWNRFSLYLNRLLSYRTRIPVSSSPFRPPVTAPAISSSTIFSSHSSSNSSDSSSGSRPALPAPTGSELQGTREEHVGDDEAAGAETMQEGACGRSQPIK